MVDRSDSNRVALVLELQRLAGGGCILRDHRGNMVYALSNFYGLSSTIPMEHTQLVDALTEYTNPD